MKKVKIYHNNRCSKSRATLEILNKMDDVEVEIVNYILNPISKLELEKIIGLLKINSLELLRKNESEYKTLVKSLEKPTENLAIDWMVKFPKIMQRPIVVFNEKAIIGRPPENVLNLFK